MMIKNHTHIERSIASILCVFVLALLASTSLYGQSFSISTLQGPHLTQPTSLQFGPDQKLYVAQQNGVIKVFDVTRLNTDIYSTVLLDSISLIQNIQNHSDTGSTFNGLVKRQITGFHIVGTPTNPIIYVSSSDYRIGGGGGGSDLNLDTNSGIISRLTWNGSSWDMIHLVRGLPRSEENHATNGLFYNPATNILLVAQGGITNAGAPSNNFAFTCEYALSGAILSVDITAIDALPTLTDTASSEAYKYDLPTVDDPTRANANGINDPLAGGYDGVDLHDPFGGNDGLNQAKLTIGSPVQIYAPGFRNIYDLVFSEAGRLYTWDNGANVGWGGHPAKEGGDTTTNNWILGEPGSSNAGPNDAVINNLDGLHYINSSSYYGGHPNPIRANPDSAGLFTHINAMAGGQNGLFRTKYLTNAPDSSLPYDWPPVPSSLANPIEGDFQNPGIDNGSLYTHEASTNGLVEYVGSNFDAAMQGDLLAVSFNNRLWRIKINESGSINSSADVTELATGIGLLPLDVTATGDMSEFQGNIWIVDYGLDSILVLEPQDFSECTGADDNSIDEDNDGYTNADELDNNTDPCNGASRPEDFDKTLIGGFLVSNLNDPDDDDDLLPDSIDYFVWDGSNGLNTSIPLDLPLLNGDPGTGMYGVGFTGLMSNGVDDYLTLWKTEENSDVEIVAGGAVGLFSINNITDGDASGSFNDQNDAFQFGIDVSQGTPPFVIESKMLGPLFIDTAINEQNAGIFFGTGDQDNYLKLGFHANGGTPKLRVVIENDGIATSSQYDVTGLDEAIEINFYLEIFPDDGMVQPKYALGNDSPTSLGSPITLSDDLLDVLQNQNALAIGIISTSRGTDSTLNATWDYIKVNYLPVSAIGQWIVTNDAVSCAAHGAPGSCIQGRHENGYVQVGDKFYAIGGRENNSNVNIYDPATDIWTVGADAPVSLHHFQAVVVDNTIWVVGAFSGGFPNESNATNIYIYDPDEDAWYEGPEIPASRRRGSGGVGFYNGKIYWAGGITNGHVNGWVPWLDSYNPSNGVWSILPNATRARDHFQATVANNNLYLVGGRRTSQGGNTFTPVEQMIDVFDFNTQSWDTLTNQLPTGRAGASIALLGNEIFAIGGEIGGSSTALTTTQALNLTTNNWRSVASLNTGRHGTQAIVNNGGIYTAGGSPQQGEATTQVEEAYYLFGQTTPFLNSYISSELIASADTLDFGEVNSTDSVSLSINFSNNSNDQGMLITDLQLANDIDYSFSITRELPFFLRANQSFNVSIKYKPDGLGSDLSVLTVSHSGLENETQVLLFANGALQPPGIYINCGGPSVLSNDTYWQADDYFTNNTFSYQNLIDILDTDQDTLFQTGRSRNGNFSYNIPIDTQYYDMNLHFAEIEFVDNGTASYSRFARKFDISIEGDLIYQDFNINDLNFPETNAKALIISMPVKSSDGTLNILFEKLNQLPVISAISLVPRDCVPENLPCNDNNPFTIEDITDGNCGCEGVIPEYIYLEAECGTVGSLWSTVIDASGSDNKVLRPPNFNSIGAAQSSPSAQVVIPFFISSEGDFKIHGRVKTSSTGNDSYWVKVDDGPWYNWNQINATPYTNTYEWDEVHNYLSGPGIIPLTFNLSSGMHEIFVAYREKNSRLDQFFVTNTDSIPVGIVEEGTNCGACMTNTTYTDIDLALCTGDSIIINGSYQNSSGTYGDTLTSSDGCDSILIYTLFDADTFHLFDMSTICSNDSIFLEGAWQNTAGLYIDMFTSQFGCDSIIETTLSVNPIFIDTSTIEICIGDSVFVQGGFQTTGGLYIDSLIGTLGCDSLLYIQLNILDTSSFILEVEICAGESFIYNDFPYKETGVYRDTFQNTLGCDSVFTLDLQVNPIYDITVEAEICAGDSLFVGGEWQKVAGHYIDSLQTITGCDSIKTTDLILLDTSITLLNVEICAGDSLEYNGMIYTEEGMYKDTFQNEFGCDSIFTLTLQVNPIYDITVEAEICAGDSLFVGGEWQKVAGHYIDSLQTITGCDSIKTTDLILLDTSITLLNVEICAGDSLEYNGMIYTEEGMYKDTFQNELGCDSIFTLALQVHPIYDITIEVEICAGDSLFVGGEWQKVAGQYIDSLQTIAGCDSIKTTDLILLDTSTTSLQAEICAGETFEYNGKFYSELGMYKDTFQNTFGCDSLINIDLMVLPIFDITIEVEICDFDSVFLEGVWQNEAGIYNDVFTAQSGCDSIVQTTLIILAQCDWPGGEIVYVDSSAIGLNNGYNWVDAFNDLQDALDVDFYYDNINQIWVAKGTYYPTVGTDRSASFVLKDTVELYGSFVGVENTISQRDTNIITSVLSGDIGIVGDSMDDSYHIIEIDENATGIFMDGFQIEKATSNGINKDSSGGAIMNDGIAHFKNINVLDISSTSGGRVIHVSGPSAILTLEKATIFDQGPSSIYVEDGSIFQIIQWVEVFK